MDRRFMRLRIQPNDSWALTASTMIACTIWTTVRGVSAKRSMLSAAVRSMPKKNAAKMHAMGLLRASSATTMPSKPRPGLKPWGIRRMTPSSSIEPTRPPMAPEPIIAIMNVLMGLMPP